MISLATGQKRGYQVTRLPGYQPGKLLKVIGGHLATWVATRVTALGDHQEHLSTEVVGLQTKRWRSQRCELRFAGQPWPRSTFLLTTEFTD